MSLSIDNLTHEALSLSIEERAALAARIVESIDNDVPKIPAAWLNVAERRRQEVLAGTAITMDAADVSVRMRSRLK